MGHRMCVNPVIRRRTASTSPIHSDSEPRSLTSPDEPSEPSPGVLEAAFRQWRSDLELGSVMRLWRGDKTATSNWNRLGHKVAKARVKGLSQG